MFNTGFWISYLSAILNLLYILVIFKNITHTKPCLSIYKILIIIILFSIIITINNLYNNNFLKFFSTLTIIIIMNKLCFKLLLNDTIYYSFWVMGILLIIDSICGIMSIYSASNIFDYNNNCLYKFFYSLLIIILVYASFKNNKIIKSHKYD
jgi:hypothetical protein